MPGISELAAEEAGEREDVLAELGLELPLADQTREYHYLAGPMTGIPQFNFPAFHAAAERLRGQGYNIISPAELDPSVDRERYEASPDGGGQTFTPEYTNLLARDIAVIAADTCVGLICLAGWRDSRGATSETTVAKLLDKPVYELSDGGLTLTQVLWNETARRPSLAEKAVRLVHGDRGRDYGHPLDDFKRSALIMTAILSRQLKDGEAVRPDQIPPLMIAVKLSRLAQTPYHADSLADIHGYGLTWEMVWDKQREEDKIADTRKAIADFNGNHGA